MSAQLLVAIDPFARDQVDLKKSMSTVNVLASALQTQAEPVSVVSPEQVQWPLSFDGTWAQQFQVAAEKRLKKNLKSSGLKAAKEKIFTQPMHSTKASVEVITNFARDEKAKALVAFTHYRKAPHFRLFGSFATALVGKSSTPVLFINAKGKAVRKFGKILFATDFAEESEAAFKVALDWAVDLKAEIVIFHALTAISPDVYSSMSLAGGFTAFDLYIKDEEQNAIETGQRWVQLANQRGCKAEAVVNHTISGAAKAVLEAADRFKADLVMTYSKVKGFEAVILGSVSRDILEMSKLPVLVIPTATVSASKNNAATRSSSTKLSRNETQAHSLK